MNGATLEEIKQKLNLALYRYWQRRFDRYLKWAKIRTSGLEKIVSAGPALLAPNHSNWKDIPLLGTLIQRPIHFVATFQLFDRKLCHEFLDQYFIKICHNQTLKGLIHHFNRFLSKFLVDRITQLGCIPAKMELSKYNFIESAKAILTLNRLMCVFPEGTLSTPEKLKRFKFGIAKIVYDYYLEFQKSIPTFPVGINGTHKFYYSGIELEINVGSPLYIEQFIEASERRTLKNFVNELRNSVQRLINCQDNQLFSNKCGE